MEEAIEKILNGARSKYDRRISIVYNGPSQNTTSNFICCETFKNDLDFAKMDKTKFEEVPKAAKSLAESSKKETETIGEIKSELSKVNESDILRRDERFKEVFDSIDDFSKEMNDTIDQFCEELKPMLKPFLFGGKNIERLDILQKGFDKAAPLENDLEHLELLKQTGLAKETQAANNQILSSHVKRNVWKHLVQILTMLKGTQKKLNQPLKADAEKFTASIESISQKAIEVSLNLLKLVSVKMSRCKIVTVLLSNFDIPDGDINKLCCGLSRDKSIAYCKGSASGCIGWGQYPLSIWGSGPYTEGSSYCIMGVHQGFYDRESGGIYKTRLIGQRDNFVASTKNGITSASWGAYGAIDVSPYIF